MSNFVSIIPKAYSNNIIDEAREAWTSSTTIHGKWREPASEVDLAKIVGFAAKIIGTASLVHLALSTYNIAQKRSCSLGRLISVTISFFAACDFLQVGNNLRFEYTMSLSDKAKIRKAEKGSGWFSGMRARASHTIERVKHAAEEFAIDDPDTIEEFRMARVFQVAVKDTCVLGPLFRIAVGGKQ